ncbi:MAG: flavin reductase family protein [Deltaproteobacteria bacterium]|nr:flavin reductase family protein [Deltaproteobacteria bacterium]
MKTTLGAKNCLYPMPVVLVGALVNGEPNYITVTHVGIMDFCAVSVSIGKSYYTNSGVKEHETFSINIPSVDMVKETEYCGLVSGKNVDKARLFDNFYGELTTAPMIRECPINMECKLLTTIDLPRHNVFVGEIVQTYCHEEYQTNGVVNFSKVQPILFVMDDTGYWKLGEEFAKAWNVRAMENNVPSARHSEETDPNRKIS